MPSAICVVANRRPFDIVAPLMGIQAEVNVSRFQFPAWGRIGIALFAGIMVMAWTALILAGLGRFQPVWPLLAGGVAGGLVYRYRRAQEQPGFVPFAVVCSVFTLMLTLPPGESILGNWDPGVYVHTASMIARDGGILLHEADLLDLTPEERELVARIHGRMVEPFGGMRLIRGRTTPQFYHLYPSLMAMLSPLGGLRAMLWLNPLLNIGCLLALFALASRVLDRRWACAAVVVLALHPAQIWMARFSTAEILTQFLLLGGFVLLWDALRQPGRYSIEAFLAGVAFGLAQLTRYDTLLLLAPLLFLLFSALAHPRYRRPVSGVLIALAPLMVHTILHQRFIAVFYRPLSGNVLPVLGLLCVALLAVIALSCIPAVRRVAGRVAGYAVIWRAVLGVLFLAWAAWAWWWRPLWPVASWASWIPAGREAYNMLYLDNLFGPLGLALALAGVVVLVVRVRGLASWVWLLPCLSVTMFFVMRVYHDHFMMWVSRRFVPVAIPFLAVALAACCFQVAEWLGRRWTRGVWSGALLLALVLALNLPASWAMAKHRDWPGLIDWYDGVVAQLPAGARVYTDQPGFAAPLRYLYGYSAFQVWARHREGGEDLFGVMRQHAVSRPVYFLTMREDIPHPDLAEAAHLPLDSVMQDHPRREVPRTVKERSGDFVLYRVLPPER